MTDLPVIIRETESGDYDFHVKMYESDEQPIFVSRQVYAQWAYHLQQIEYHQEELNKRIGRYLGKGV